MRKLIEFVFFMGVIFLCLAFNTSMASPKREYIVTSGDGEYILSNGYSDRHHKSLGDCIKEVESGSTIRLVNITSDEHISFPEREYVVSGNLMSSGIISIPEGASVKFENLTLLVNDGAYVRVKGGSLTMASSEISGDTTLIRLDYSSTSSLDIISGKVTGKHDGALIDIKNGSATISGADIHNLGGVAINNESDLHLTASPSIIGVAYDIYSECHISLGSNTAEYYSIDPLRVQYADEFLEGTLTEIFYRTTERSLSQIKVYDKNGKEQELTYFEKCSHNGEGNIAAIYLPYTVKFYAGDRIVLEQKLLAGEKLTAFTPDYKEGYSFDNWYLDANLTEPFYQDKRVYSSFSLYASYSLEPPTFSISSLDFIYDGKEHTLKFDNVSHALPGGYYSYEWYKNKEKISALSELLLKNVSDSGVYECVITYTLNGKTASVYAQNIKVNIKKQTILLLNISTAEYTGTPLYPAVLESPHYDAECASGTDVGSYPIIFTLTDPENTKWQNTEESSVTAFFEITKAANHWITEPTVSDTYVGTDITPSAMSSFGTVIFLYSATESGSYTRDIPKSPGVYYMKAAVLESANYSGLVSNPIRFEILTEQVVGLRLAYDPQKTDYFAFEIFDAGGLVVFTIYNSGREEELQHSRPNVIYSNGECFHVGDDKVILEYLGASISIPISVSPLSYDLSSFSFTDSTVIYNGDYQTAQVSAPIIVGRDGIPLVCTLLGGGTNVGEYTITATFNSESRDYIIPCDMTAILTVLPLEVDLIWQNTEFIYDGNQKVPKATFVDVKGITRDVQVCGSAVYANDGYVATAIKFSENYVFKNPSVIYDIKKANYDVSSVSWSFETSTYTGEAIEVIIKSLPDGVSVAGYTDNRAINVGKYTATASFVYDTKNYNPPAIAPHQWEITKAEYDMSGVEFVSAVYEYDGNEHFPIQSGDIPIGKDGIQPTYSFSFGVKNVTEGAVSIIITFYTESDNYIAPDPIVSTVKIIPKGIYVLWTNDSFVYNGTLQSPSATCEETEIAIEGARQNAGEYIATAKSKDPNFIVVNETYSYKIEKAKNYWLTPPTISDFYESGSPSPNAAAYFGSPVYKYYDDSSMNNEVLPILPGEYYLVSIIPESENYKELISSPIKFTCMKVSPIGIRCEINGTPVAFSTLEGILSSYLLFNDGSSEIIKYSDLQIDYQSADTLRCSDTECKVSYGDFLEIIPVSVAKAEYDMSSAFWDFTTVEYDGNYHAPTLNGLPFGVSVASYSQTPVIYAGDYEFSAELYYDTENYNMPKAPVCHFTISKAVVPVIEDQVFEYCGKSVYPQIYNLTLPKTDGEIINSGKYEVKYVLTDNENYIFENGADFCIVNIMVQPRILKVSVEDFVLYMFENNITPEYTIDGLIKGVEPPNFYYFVEGDRIYIKTDDVNYLLDVEYGTLERVNYPSESMRRKITIVALIFIACILVTVLFVKKRNDILNFLSMLKAKNKNKTGIGYICNAPIPEYPALLENNDRGSFIDGKVEKVTEDEELLSNSYSNQEYEDDIQNINNTGKPSMAIKEDYADTMITDDMANSLIKNEREIIYTDGKAKSIVNVDTLSRNFVAEDRVDVNILKEKSLVPYDVGYIKVLARGAIDKPLSVYANDFSLPAVKMILLSGGKAVKVKSAQKEKDTNQ